MKRTTVHHWRELREIRTFFSENRRLFPFMGLFLAGVAIGVLIYAGGADTADWDSLLRVPAVTGGFRETMGALWSASFSTLVLLVLLFLLGLWACGAPFVLAVPLFQGLGLGLTEAYYYALGRPGVLAVATVVMPHGLLTGAVVLMAGVESLRLSVQVSRQLLPGAPCGGLWPVFRLYCLRFLLFLLAAVAAGILNVLLRRAAAGWLP